MVETTSRAKSHTSQQQQRSLSPSGRFCSSSISSSSSSAFTAQSRSTFYYNSPRSTTTLHHQRSSSPTRVSLAGFSSPSSSSSVYFSIDRPTSPVRSFSVNKVVKNKQIGTTSHHHHHQLPSRQPKKTCMCSPTTHPGSFRCSFHKAQAQQQQQQQQSYQPHRLNMRRSAMTNSLVRIGTVEGEWVKRALATLIRPSSHHQRRRGDFQPRPSRLCMMSKAEDL